MSRERSGHGAFAWSGAGAAAAQHKRSRPAAEGRAVRRARRASAFFIQQIVIIGGDTARAG